MLTDADCRNAKCPHDRRRVRLSDSQGLYLEVSPTGSRRWFWKFVRNGKEGRLAIGVYPDVSLSAARLERDRARLAHKDGINPVQQRKVERAQQRIAADNTFAAVAREYHQTHRDRWSEVHATQWLRLVEKDLFPYIGAMPLNTITPPLLLDVLRRVQQRGALRLAHDLRQNAGAVFRYGISTARCERNVAADLRGALKPFVEKHASAVLKPKEFGALLRAIDGYQGQPLTRGALLLSALTFQRPHNIREAEWQEFDLDRALWTIPSAKMKRTVHGKLNGRPQVVPLSRQAIELLRDELHPLSGHGKFVFPSLLTGERCMSENTVRGALRRLGFSNDEATAQGFRASARTLLVQELDADPEVVEAQLAHGKKGVLREAYDRAQYVEKRQALMQQWADYLDQLRDGAQVIPMPGRAA
jgi:integrase